MPSESKTDTPSVVSQRRAKRREKIKGIVSTVSEGFQDLRTQRDRVLSEAEQAAVDAAKSKKDLIAERDALQTELDSLRGQLTQKTQESERLTQTKTETEARLEQTTAAKAEVEAAKEDLAGKLAETQAALEAAQAENAELNTELEECDQAIELLESQITTLKGG